MKNQISTTESVFVVYAIKGIGHVANIVVDATTSVPFSFSKREDAIVLLKDVIQRMPDIDGAMIREVLKKNVENHYIVSALVLP